jgi:hypothetical protein
MLRPRALDLPETGWGLIRVTEADDGMDEPVEPKTGHRVVPIPPVQYLSPPTLLPQTPANPGQQG